MVLRTIFTFISHNYMYMHVCITDEKIIYTVLYTDACILLNFIIINVSIYSIKQ
jgi:hypothetical protein